MPRITEERREARRQQILDAARACMLEQGLEAMSMEMIIARSGLSTGAVYRYFKGKDAIIEAAITTAAQEIGAAVAPILAGPAPGPPSELVGRLLAAWVSYSHSGVGAAAGIDRMPTARRTPPAARRSTAGRAGHCHRRPRPTPRLRGCARRGGRCW